MERRADAPGCRSKPHLRFLALLAAAAVWPGSARSVAAVPPRYSAGEAAVFSRTVDVQPVRAVLYYRVAGTRPYQRAELPVRDGRVSVEIPASAVVPPGVEYYLEVTTADGRVVTDPAVYPTYHPYRIEVAATGLRGAALVGAPNGRVPAQGPLVMGLDGASAGVRFFLDGADVTSAVERHGSQVRYVPPAPLEPGRHVLVAEVPGGHRVEVPFVAEGPVGGPKGVLAVDGSVSFNYGRNVSSRDTASSDRVSGNLNLEFSAQKGEFAARFSGVNLQYVKDAPDEFTISSGYLLTLAYGTQSFEFGDLSIDETPLTASGFARRGARLNLEVRGIKARLYNVRADTVEGFEAGVSLDDPGSQVYGLAVEAPLLPDDRFSIHLSAVTGRNESRAGFNTGTSLGPSRGRTVGLGFRGTLFGTNLGGEFAWSRFDPDTTQGPGMQADTAWQVNASRDLGVGSLSLGLLRYGSDYATIANPNFTGDRQAVQAGFSSGLGPISLNLSGAYSEDNVDRDDDRPIVSSLAGNASVGVAVPGWPALNLGYGVSRQKSRSEPPGGQAVDNVNHTVKAGLSYGRDHWNAGLSASMGFLQNRLSGGSDARTRSITLSGGWNGERLSITPSLSYNESDSDGPVYRTRLATLSLTLPLWPEVVDLSGQGSYQRADTSDGSVNTATLNGSVRLSWNVQALLKRVGLGWANVQLAVSADYNRHDDHNDPSRDRRESVVFLTFNLGVPYRFRAETEW
ncbi:hypothetical protein [Deferrisoma camini]|uniref:hypothetical protein n=1 Tax=Deferrisoma camini TaxID=1035120 RepID=UPI00046D4164|nr:hypothetical protein [Deferrisoma camini]